MEDSRGKFSRKYGKIALCRSVRSAGEIVFHEGVIGGAWPTVVG